MEAFHLTQKVRPLRLLLWITEENEDQALFASQLNCALWGGMLNPIVSLEQGEEYLDSVFKASRADFGINLSGKPWPAQITSRYRDRLKPLERFDGLIEQGVEGYCFHLGCDMVPVFSDFWEQYGRFRALSKTDDASFLYIEGVSDDWHKYVCFTTGTYPANFKYNYTAGYIKTTRCKRVLLNEETLSSVSLLRSNTPLQFTLSNLNLYYPTNWNYLDSHIVYIGEMTNVRHWLEFWNLRSCGITTLFVPWDRISGFAPQIQEYITEGNYPINDQVENRTILQKASTLPEESFNQAVKSIRELADEKPPVVIRTWIPRFGLAIPARDGEIQHAPPLESLVCVAHEQEDIVLLSDNRIEFKLALPSFLLPYKKDLDRAWAIALSGREPSEKDIWVNYPALDSLSDMLKARYHLMLTDFKLCPRENLVIFRNDRIVSDFFSMSLPNTLQVFKAILAESGLTLTDYSEKGKYASGIEGALGGFFEGAMILLDKGVRKLLQRLTLQGGRCHLPRKELEKTIGEHSQLIRESAVRGEKISPSNIVDTLIRKQVLRPGLEFKCKHCYRQGWYDLSQCGDTFVCQYCYEEQPIPVLDGKEWRYRASGLFGTQDVGYGSLAVICTSLFFRSKFMHDVRHIYSFEFTNQGGETREIDLAFLRLGFDGKTELAFCECKSTEFEEKDFERLAEVAVSVPGSVVCAATLKEMFSSEEKDRAIQLWDAGHRIILLTSSDLEYSGIGLDGVEGRHRHFHSFSDLAHSTKAKYLNSDLKKGQLISA
ncbi:MAG: hypothetical protein JXR84_06540 [Anaerolineae bacterium]|nr:hypothetical protein [Anaerolineae bacterium]